jgi:endonuclease YncB( thermonuclease family)
MDCNYDVSSVYFTDSLAGKTVIARVSDVYDGDTLTVVFPVEHKMYSFKIRIFGIDTYEIRNKDIEEKKLAVQARNLVINLISDNKFGEKDFDSRDSIKEIFKSECFFVKLDCHESDKYGRLLADVSTSNGVDIVSVLLEKKLGYIYDGGTKM